MHKSRVIKSGYIGPPPDQQLIEDLRQQVKAGTTVPHLVETIKARIPEDYNTCMWSINYLIHAFHLDIKAAKDLGGWNRFGNPGYTGEQINATMMPLIIENQSLWDEEFHND